MSTLLGKPCRFGTHRVLEPEGVLPQAAWKLDATPVAHENEILCDVEALNIDSASFRQISEANGGNVEAIATHVRALVTQRGKHHNPVTGSGGMFIGRVREVGATLAARCELQPGDRIASLVSLSLTPLSIESIESIELETGRIWIRGTAVLFETGIYAKLPDDIPDDVSLAVLDVAGAPAQVARLVEAGQTVAVLGADGKSGVLACAQARARAGADGRVVGFGPDANSPGAHLLRDAGYVDAFVEADCRDVPAFLSTLERALPELADVTINCVNVPGTELPSILATKDGGTVYFFSMNTSFTAASLGAEGVGKDVSMIIGNGYVRGHADLALRTLRERPTLMQYFKSRYGRPTN